MLVAVVVLGVAFLGLLAHNLAKEWFKIKKLGFQDPYRYEDLVGEVINKIFGRFDDLMDRKMAKDFYDYVNAQGIKQGALETKPITGEEEEEPIVPPQINKL